MGEDRVKSKRIPQTKSLVLCNGKFGKTGSGLERLSQQAS